MKKTTFNLTMITLISFFSWGTHAQLGFQNFRHIHINGTHLTDQQILELDNTLGVSVPNGFYWVNETTGEWGYEGNNEVLGSIYGANITNGQQPSSQTQPQAPVNTGSNRPYISNDTGTGSAVISPTGCSYVSSGGMTFRSCD